MDPGGPLNEGMIPETGYPSNFIAGKHYLLPSEKPLRYSDIPDLSNEDFRAGMLQLQEDIEYARQDFFGADYLAHKSPFTMGISDLPKAQADEFIRRWDELTGNRDFWSGAGELHGKGQGPTPFRDYYEGGEKSRSFAGRQEFTPEEINGNIRAIYAAQDTVRFDDTSDKTIDGLVGERYMSAGTKYRPNVQEHFKDLLDSNLNTPGVIGILDVESASLNPEDGIWQFSIRLMKDGQKIQDKTVQVHNARMQWAGRMGADGLSLEDFLREGEELPEFSVRMKEALDVINQADWIGGHNVFFDYGMLSRGLKKHKAYRADTVAGREYKLAVDLFHSKFMNPETGDIGNVVDTAALARLIMPKIGLAPELKGSHSPYQHSLQNLLLRTNLWDKIKAKESPEEVSRLLSRGLHFADVDVPIESHLYTALQKHQLFLKGLKGGEELKVGDHFLDDDTRKLFVHSRAVGPSIAMSEISQVHPSLVARAKAAGLIEEIGDDYRIKLTPMEQMVALQRDMTMGGKSSLAGLYPESQTLKEAMREQGIWRGLKGKFWDVSSAGDTDFDVAARAGTWTRMSRWREDQGIVRPGWITKGGQVAVNGHPNDATWRLYQQELADKQIPLPGMSWIERHISSELGRASVANMDRKERDVRSIFGGDVASVGRFLAPEKINVVGESEIATIPLQYLEQWERSRLAMGENVSTAFSRPLEQSQFLYLSPFRYAEKKRDEIGLMYQIEHEEDKTSLMNFLRNHPDLAGDDDMLTKLESAFRHNSGTYGIQVGTLGHMRGDEVTSRFAETLRQMSGIGADKSDQTPSFWVHLLGRDVLGDQGGEKGTVNVAGAFMQTGMFKPEELEGLPEQMSGVLTQYKRLYGNFQNNRRANFFRTRALHSAEEQEGAGRFYRIGEKALTRAPVFAAGAAIAGGAYYMHKRAQQNARLDETMAYQPEESDDWYDRTKNQDVPGDPRRSPDYLNTASVVRNADRRKVNHTQMGPDKYSYLYKV